MHFINCGKRDERALDLTTATRTSSTRRFCRWKSAIVNLTITCFSYIVCLENNRWPKRSEDEYGFVRKNWKNLVAVVKAKALNWWRTPKVWGGGDSLSKVPVCWPSRQFQVIVVDNCYMKTKRLVFKLREISTTYIVFFTPIILCFLPIS